MMRIYRIFCAVLLCVVFAACSPDKGPAHIGFIGGLTDRNAANGQAGLNGVILALEEFNRAGGLNGRRVELISRDDAQNKDTAAKAARELVEAQVEAVIGPFTSSMATVIVPILGQAGIFQISPTITSMDFYGKDDNLFRLNRTTRDNANDYAQMMVARGQKAIALAFDTRNRSFAESWLQEFREAVKARGARIVAEVPYESSAGTDFAGVVRQMKAARPDSLFFISGSLDVARLAQQARIQAPNLPIGASEWAATEQLIDLGGKVVEGLLIVQNYNRDDDSPRFKDFTEAYFKRFQRNADYSALSAYEAATVVLTALNNRQSGETTKAAALRSGPYQGVQQLITFDANGDTPRQVFFNEIKDGRYQSLK